MNQWKLESFCSHLCVWFMLPKPFKVKSAPLKWQIREYSHVQGAWWFCLKITRTQSYIHNLKIFCKRWIGLVRRLRTRKLKTKEIIALPDSGASWSPAEISLSLSTAWLGLWCLKGKEKHPFPARWWWQCPRPSSQSRSQLLPAYWPFISKHGHWESNTSH